LIGARGAGLRGGWGKAELLEMIKLINSEMEREIKYIYPNKL